jgi:hypothetical protein
VQAQNDANEDGKSSAFWNERATMKDDTVEDTISILNDISGGRELIAWFGGRPEFCDAEVLELRLVRHGPSCLRLATMVSKGGKYTGPPFKHAVFDFTLRDMIDVDLNGFGYQNVISGLALRRAQDRALHPSLLGIGLVPGEVEIVLEPCAGAFGMIRCTIDKITIRPVENYQKADQIGMVPPT